MMLIMLISCLSVLGITYVRNIPRVTDSNKKICQSFDWRWTFLPSWQATDRTGSEGKSTYWVQTAKKKNRSWISARFLLLPGSLSCKDPPYFLSRHRVLDRTVNMEKSVQHGQQPFLEILKAPRKVKTGSLVGSHGNLYTGVVCTCL